MLGRFQAIATGLMTEIQTYGTADGEVKIALYADSSGEPGSLIVANNNGQSVTKNQWNTLSIPQANITKDTYYWLAFNLSVTSVITALSSGGYRRHKTATYSTFTFPDPAGSGFTSSGYRVSMGAWGVCVVSPSGISQPVSYGSPQLTSIFSIKPSGISQPLAYGTPGVVSIGIISPQGITVGVATGPPALCYPQTISPTEITQQVSVGMPWLGVFGFLKLQGIAQQIPIGSPSLYKYVWHVILDGQYEIESPEKNRVFIIGRDQYGNPVWGTAVDSAELGLVGERLDFQQEVAIATTAEAESMADALLSKMRLSKKRGVILMPPNCGQELFDVVQISDSGANQSAVSFRVVGIRFEYSSMQARYEHRLFLGNV